MSDWLRTMALLGNDALVAICNWCNEKLKQAILKKQLETYLWCNPKSLFA